MKSYLQRLKDFNSKLKAKKREVIIITIINNSDYLFNFIFCLGIWYLSLVIFNLLYLFSFGGSRSNL